jgi:hypothetical protein
MSVVWGKGERIDSLVGELPDRYWICLLVLGMNRFVDVN